MGDIKINVNEGIHIDEDGENVCIVVDLHRQEPPFALSLTGPVGDLVDLFAACPPGEDWETQAASTFGSSYSGLPAAVRTRIRQGWQILRAAARA